MKRTLNSYVNGQTMGCCSSNNYDKVGTDVAYTYYRCSRSKKIGWGGVYMALIYT
jgi:hypothetical protein